MLDFADSFSRSSDPLSYAAAILEKGSAQTIEEFCEIRLGEEMYSKQREITRSVLAHRRTAVKSCHDAGKSYIASRTATWWIDSHPFGEAFVVSTAPSNDQVRGILWREINRAHKKGGLAGRVNQTEWWIENELVAYGRKPQDQDPGAFQGIHAKYVLVIIDEACFVPKDLWIAAGSLAANEYSRILAIGNPDDPGSHFAEVCKPGTGWNVIQISYKDTPNFTDELVSPGLKDLLISPLYVEEMRHDLGEASAPFQSKCLGEFPQDAEDAVCTVSSLMKCMKPEQEHTAKEVIPVELGWDVGAGGDRSVLRERRGVKAGRVWYPRGGEDTMAQVGEVVRVINQTKARAIKVDTIGVGHGAADRLEELRREGKHQARVVRVNVSEVASDPVKFRRKRDEIWWTIAHDMISDGVLDLYGLDDQCVAQLLAPRYKLDSAGRINVEPKEETKERLSRSPDDADALLLAFYAATGQGRAFVDMWKRRTPKSAAQPAAEQPVASAAPVAESVLKNTVFSLTGRRPALPTQPSKPRNSCEHRWRPETGLCVFCGAARQ